MIICLQFAYNFMVLILCAILIRTNGIEMIDDVPDADAIVVPVGGAGLIAGIACAVKTLRPCCKVRNTCLVSIMGYVHYLVFQPRLGFNSLLYYCCRLLVLSQNTPLPTQQLSRQESLSRRQSLRL